MNRLVISAATFCLSYVVAQTAVAQVLEFNDVIFGGAGLKGAADVVVSPDDNHIYISTLYDAVAAFSRNSTTGELSFIAAQYDEINGVDGLDGAEAITISPGGKHVYVAGNQDDAVAVFSRNPGTGVLTYVEAQFDSVDGVVGLKQPRSVAVSPDGAHVYVGGRYAVTVFNRDAGTGALSFVDAYTSVTGTGLITSTVTMSSDGAHVYVASDFDESVALLTRNAITGELTYVEALVNGAGGVEGLDGAGGITLSPDGSHVYVAGSSDDAVAAFSRNPATGQLTFVEAEFDGVDGVDGLNGANTVRLSADGNHVYVSGTFDDSLVVFGRNSGTGALTFIERQYDNQKLNDARGLAISPGDSHLYVVASHFGWVSGYDRDETSGELTVIQTISDSVGGPFGLTLVQSVEISPDGKHAYAASFSNDAVTVFERDLSNGELTFVEEQRDGIGGVDGLNGATSTQISLDGKNVYVTGQLDDAIAVFNRDSNTGTLTFVEVLKDGVAGVDGLDAAIDLAVSQDGRNVYAVGLGDNALAVFSRNIATGVLTFVEAQVDDTGGVNGLENALSVSIAPDGGHVYAVGRTDDAMAVFSRNASTGALTFVEAILDNSGGVDGLDQPYSVVVSPDGNQVYVAGFTDDSVAVFNRNASTGMLTFVELHKDGVSGVTGLNGASHLTTSPSGEYLFAVAQASNSLAVFRRDSTTGTLTFVESMQNAGTDSFGNSVLGIGSARSVAVSPNDANVYVAGKGSDALAVFNNVEKFTPEPLFADGFE